MDSLETQLITAVRDGDVDRVKALLNKGANVNVVASSGRTPLGTAAKAGSLPILQLLLNVNEVDNSTGGLHSKRKRERRTNRLTNTDGNTTKTVFENDTNVINCKRSDVSEDNHKNNLGYFVVVHDEETGIGVMSDSQEMDGIMDENENESLCLDEVQTPDGMEDLEWDVEVKEDESEGEEDLWACQYRWYANILDKTCCILVETSPRKCDVNLQDIQGRSAVHYAAKQGHLEALQLLTRSGCQVDLCDADNQTPLHLAAARDHVDVAKLLLSCGAEVNRKTSDKMSALHFAAARGFKNMVLVLLKAGAHIDSLDSSDRTPLLLAVSRTQTEVVDSLIKHGARVNIEEIHGYTPVCEAVWRKNVELTRMLLNAGAKLTQSHLLLQYAILHRHYEMAELLLSAGSIANLRDDNGDTPLIIAARTGQVYMAQLLLQHGAKANLGNGVTGATPLHEAVQYIRDSHFPVLESFVRVLQHHGVNLNKECWTANDTPLTRSLCMDKYKATALLIRIGADVNKCHATNVCVFDNLVLARNKRHFTLIQMLVYAGYNLQSKRLEDFSSQIPQFKAIDSWLHYMKTNPMQLTELCRLQIRRQVGDRISVVVNTLEIPKSLKRFLMLEDIELEDDENFIQNRLFI